VSDRAEFSRLHLTMHRTIRLTDNYRTISGNGLSDYWANGLSDCRAIGTRLL